MRVLETEAHKMKLLVLSAALWAVSEVSSSGIHHYGVAAPYAGVTVGLTPYSHPVHTQYHSQDAWGQYAYGYATDTSSKSETKTADGVTQGGYSYIDSNGILQTVQYISDPINGFRVAATNLPQDVPAVAYAKAQHLAAVEATRAEHALIAARVQYTNPVAYSAAAVQQVPLVALPAPVQDLPEVARAKAEHLAAFEAIKARDYALAVEHAAISPIPAQISNAVVPVRAAAVAAAPAVAYTNNAYHSYVPAVPAVHQFATSSQYQAQDALGQYTYGYVEPLSSKSETKTADGITRGGYSYIDANGIVQTVNYISDPVNGFRVAATNLPVGPAEVAAAAAPIAVAGVAAPVAVAGAAPIGVSGAIVGSAPVSTSSYSSTTVHAAAPVAVSAPVAVAAPAYAAPVAVAAPAAYSTTTYHAAAPAIAAAAPVAYSSASYQAAAPVAVSSASYQAVAPVAVGARIAAAAPVAYSSASYQAAAPVAVSSASYQAVAPVAVGARVAAAAPVAVGARVAAVAPVGHAKVVHTGPEPGWYTQEVIY